jgi:hypothetical protein
MSSADFGGCEISNIPSYRNCQDSRIYLPIFWGDLQTEGPYLGNATSPRSEGDTIAPRACTRQSWISWS